MPPGEAARRFLAAVALGLVGGFVYSFLRPVRKKHPARADLLYWAVIFSLWLEHSFRLCRGDIRPENGLGLLLGSFLFDRLLGRRLLPVFTGFWKLFRGFFRALLWPLKKFMVFLQKIGNFLLLKAKKQFTIRKSENKTGGIGHGGKEAVPERSVGVQK